MTNMQRSLARLLVPLMLGGAALGAQAQAYKCQSQGKTIYSQEPCPGGVTVNTTPAAGASPTQGQAPLSYDRRARMEALTLTAADAPDARRERRARMPLGQLQECLRLEAEGRVFISHLQDAKGQIVGVPSDAHVENRRKYRANGC